ncbi:hexosaminidase [Microbacterium sp. cf046]|uniref:family 20 glycosylhydrolase n=1 Tax=Microbacterium sp. cf046 TaxID=1761803 RepID=UPI0008EBCF4F|nr:family 20 glycosylhydrolase [Microbacterium sp. cf046]SFR95172.1 hexosaminidase [Microbacterium sp. cf046]
MNLASRLAVPVAVVVVVLLAGCTPAAQNGATVSASLPIVPAPASIEPAASAEQFRLGDQVILSGDADAVAALSALIVARTDGAVAASAGSGTESAGARTIELRLVEAAEPESYRITADAASVVVTAADAAGLFYGVQTLGQLMARDEDGFAIPAVQIDDAPRFAYRGVMLDVARHFLPVETVEAYIDRAASLKLNALHLHLSDDQGWRIALDSRPKLTELASSTAVGGDGGGFFSKADYRRIVEYAASRHMIVVPEIDLPGHTHAVGLAYPEIAEAPVLSEHILDTVRDHGGEVPTAGVAYTGMAVGFSSLKIHDEATYDFVADVVGELAAMTPGPYLHIGGDEALGTDPDDFAVFMERATAIVADLGKIPVTWHEAGAAPGIDPDTVGQYWGFLTPTDGMDDRARAFVEHDSGLILSPADAVYLDMKYDADAALGLTWANGPTSVERAYSWEPAAIIDGVAEDDILGVEAPMWTETIRTLADIDEMAFPRIAAAAEAAWSPAAADSELRTWESFRTRVGGLGPLWSSLGIGFHASDEIPWITEGAPE